MSRPVLVIGGTRGIGKLIAELLIGRGHAVRVMARQPAQAQRSLPASAELVHGDLTEPETLPGAVRDVAHIVFTAGVRSGRIAPESLVKRTDCDGVLHTMRSALANGFTGRFVYLNSIGVTVPSVAASILNLMKRNTLVWRQRVEFELRSGRLDYTIIRVGFLSSQPGGRRAIRITQTPLPLAPVHRIGRADAAGGTLPAVRGDASAL